MIIIDFLWNNAERIGAILTLLCVYLSTRNTVMAWPTSILGALAYAVVFFQFRLYADLSLQLVFVVQSVFGWYYWKDTKKKKALPVTVMDINDQFMMVLMIPLCSWIIVMLLSSYTNSTTPIADAVLTTLSIYANWMLARRKLGNWYIWITADVGYIMLFYYKGLYISTVLYAVLMILCVKGLQEWKRELKQNEG